MHFDRHIAYWAKHRHHEAYMTFDGRTMSWNELDQDAGVLAAHLIDLGLQPGDRFGVLLRNMSEWCVGFAAAIRAGAIMVPLNALFGASELSQIAADADCTAILSCPSQIAKLGIVDDAGDDRLAIYDISGNTPPTAYADIMNSGRTVPRNDRSEDDILAIVYTSGTTGVPKGIALSHRAVDIMIQRVGSRFGWEGGEERILVLAPLAFTGGIISNLAVQFAIGASAWLEAAVEPARALKALTDNRITIMAGVPALYERIAAAPDFDTADLSALNTAITGGAPVEMPLVERFTRKGVLIRQQFGVSENCGCCFSPDRQSARLRPHTCGPALPGIETEIRDNNGKPLPQGVVGEICLKSPQLMDGYWRNPEATAAAIIEGWYHTGDLGYIDEYDGLVVADRKKNMLISGGVNIYPAEIERAMIQIDGVVEVAVIGISSDTWGQEVAAIIYAPGMSDPASIMERAREMLGSMKAPKQIRFNNERLPRTASDKIARTGLTKLFEKLSTDLVDGY